MSDTPTPLFVDTGAFYAAYDEDDDHHQVVQRVLGTLGSDIPSYGPIFTSRFVLAETATLILYRVGHSEAVDALRTILKSSTFNILPVDARTFREAAEEFERYDDQKISFVDHLTGVLARNKDIEHIFAFDSDFRTLGYTLVPEDVEGRF